MALFQTLPALIEGMRDHLKTHPTEVTWHHFDDLAAGELGFLCSGCSKGVVNSDFSDFSMVAYDDKGHFRIRERHLAARGPEARKAVFDRVVTIVERQIDRPTVWDRLLEEEDQKG
jgi:hypothetical protein